MSLFRKKSIAAIQEDMASNPEHASLKKVLTVKDLTFLGIAAVIGAGIFSTIGSAAYDGGPGVSLLFVITAITCGFSALCYAEFASRIPASGSAYTYAYTSFGELVAWIIGWSLILEYSIGNIMVAISWSSYFNNLLHGIGVHLPYWLTINYDSASEALAKVNDAIAAGGTVTPAMQEVITGMQKAPLIAGHKFFMNMPAFVIVALITALAYIGIQESRKSANAMVIFKLFVIGFVIVMGVQYINADNWSPFLPNEFTGVLKGVSAVFYAYIGFDAISTTAEECKDPQRDLPRGMIYSLLICTAIYIVIALVLTGMVHYSELKVDDPLAYVFDKLGLKWIGYIISVSAVIATTSVLLVFQLGQPRIWMTMSRDGLLPKKFSKVHPKFKTPSFATIVTGLIVAIPALFLPSSLVTDLTSIGTLFAFIIVCAGVLTLPKLRDTNQKFKMPYVNGKFIVPLMYIGFIFLFKERFTEAFANFSDITHEQLFFLIFAVLAAVLSILSFVKNFSLIPICGVLFCSYLMIEIPPISWLWFGIWMAAGLLFYFTFSYKNSKLNLINKK